MSKHVAIECGVLRRGICTDTGSRWDLHDASRKNHKTKTGAGDQSRGGSGRQRAAGGHPSSFATAGSTDWWRPLCSNTQLIRAGRCYIFYIVLGKAYVEDVTYTNSKPVQRYVAIEALPKTFLFRHFHYRQCTTLRWSIYFSNVIFIDNAIFKRFFKSLTQFNIMWLYDDVNKICFNHFRVSWYPEQFARAVNYNIKYTAGKRWQWGLYKISKDICLPYK